MPRDDRAETHFINQLVEFMAELADLEISLEAHQVLHKIEHHINHYTFNQMVKRRK